MKTTRIHESKAARQHCQRSRRRLRIEHLRGALLRRMILDLVALLCLHQDMPVKQMLAEMLPYLKTIASGVRYRSGCTLAGFEPEDLAQLTVMRAMEKLESLPARESERQRYILRIMANLLRDAIEAAGTQKRGGGRVDSLDEMLATLSECALRLDGLLHNAPPGPRTMVQRREMRQIISAEVQALPPAQRAAVELHLVSGLTLAETAAEMGWSDGQTRGYVERGKEALQQRLRTRGLQP